jgi:hypothetical protein
MFLKFSICSPSLFSLAPHFIPFSFAQSSPLLTYIGEPKGRHKSILSENFYFEETFKFEFVLGDGSIKMTHHHTKKR